MIDTTTKQNYDDIPASIENILGEEYSMNNVRDSQNVKVSQHDLARIAADDDVISNSNSVFENEKIQREHEERINKDKIELQIELTVKQKQIDEKLMFGSFP